MSKPASTQSALDQPDFPQLSRDLFGQGPLDLVFQTLLAQNYLYECRLSHSVPHKYFYRVLNTGRAGKIVCQQLGAISEHSLWVYDHRSTEPPAWQGCLSVISLLKGISQLSHLSLK